MKVLPKVITIVGLILLAAVFGSFAYYWLTEENLYVHVYLFVVCMAFIGAVVVYFRAVGPKLIKLLEDQEKLESERHDLEDKQSEYNNLQWKLVQKDHELEKRENYLRDEIRIDLTRKLVPEVKAELAKKFKKEVNQEVRASKRHMLDRNARLSLAHRLLIKNRVRILELRSARSQLIFDLQKSEGENRELSGQVKHLNTIVEQHKNWDNETAMKMIPHLSQSTLLKALHKRKDFADLKAKLRSGR